MDSEKAVLISIIYQLLDTEVDISHMNPHVQDYLYGLIDEFCSEDPEEQKRNEAIYYYADVFFNSFSDNKRKLH